MNYKTRPDEDAGFGQIIPFCGEYTLSRVNPESLQQFLEEQLLDLSLKFRSDVLISRGKSRFVDEVHILDAELRSSAELLTEPQKSGGGMSCEVKSKTGNQETGATHVSSQTGNMGTCANSLSIPSSQASLFTQRTIPTTKRKWKVIPATDLY